MTAEDKVQAIVLGRMLVSMSAVACITTAFFVPDPASVALMFVTATLLIARILLGVKV